MTTSSQLVDLDFNGVAKATRLIDPVLAQDAATKAYVDGKVPGHPLYIQAASPAPAGPLLWIQLVGPLPKDVRLILRTP